MTTNEMIAFFSLLVAVIAVAVAIYTSRIPYEKKLEINLLPSGEDDKDTVFSFINTGNKSVVIKEYGLIFGFKKEFGIASEPLIVNLNSNPANASTPTLQFWLNVENTISGKLPKRYKLYAIDNEGNKYISKDFPFEGFWQYHEMYFGR